MKTKFSFIIVLLSVIAFLPCARAGQYFQDFSAFNVGATSFGDGSQLFTTSPDGVASVQDGTHKELQLTEYINDTDVTSAFELPPLDPGAPVYAFSVKWNSQIYGNFPAAADGFSLNFGQLSALNLTSGDVESGYSAGLCFSVQTDAGNNPGFYVRVNGNTLASVSYDPLTQWGSYNTTRHFWEVDWNYTNGLTVHLDGQAIFTNVATAGFSPEAGDVFVWAARCDGLIEEVRLDNIVAVTGGNLVSAAAAEPYYTDANVINPAANAFDGDNDTYWGNGASFGYVGATVSAADPVMVYALTSSTNLNNGSAYDPLAWTLQGSGDAGADWTNCGAGGGYFLNREETRAWLATNSTDYGAYRLDISSNVSGGGFTALGELRLYQFVPYVPVAAPSASTPVGFNGSGANWSTNQSGSYTTPAISDNQLTLTDGGENQARSVFFNDPQYIGAFQASFTYQATGNAAADGVAFVLQNDPRGASALGDSGGSLGVGSTSTHAITPSAELELNLYNTGHNENKGYTFLTNGLTGANGDNGNYQSLGDINLSSGDPINVTLNYANGQLALTFTDTVSEAWFTTNLDVGNLTNIVGGATAYVGFTGGDGSATSIQIITNFSFVSIPPEAIRVSGANVVISWPSAVTGYTLQENSDLTTTNWVNVTNLPTLNATNDQNQIVVPLTSTNMFYRLILQ